MVVTQVSAIEAGTYRNKGLQAERLKLSQMLDFRVELLYFILTANFEIVLSRFESGASVLEAACASKLFAPPLCYKPIYNT